MRRLPGLVIAAAFLASILPTATALAEPASATPGPAALGTIDEIRRLTPQGAAAGRRVRLKAVVTYYHHEWEMLFLQDATGAIFVYADHRRPPFPIRLGQLVEIEGKTVPGDFAASIAEPRIRPLEDVGLPPTRPATLPEIANPHRDALWSEVRGIVRQATIVDDMLEVILAMDGGMLKVHVQEFDEGEDLAVLVDSTVSVRGVATTVTNEQRQFLGVELWSPDRKHVAAQEKAPLDPFAAAPHPLGSLRRYAFTGGHERRLRVTGTVTLQQPNRGVFIQDEQDGVYVQTLQAPTLQPGDRIDALGFLALADGRPILEHGSLRRIDRGAPPMPVVVTPEEALQGAQDARLVRIKGRFVGRVVGTGDEALVLREGDLGFDARLEGPPTPALASLQIGSQVEVTGICSPLRRGASGPASFQVLLRSPADLVVIRNPTWWTASRIASLLQVMTAIFVAALAWAVMLRRRVRRQTGIIRERLEREAALEQRYRDLVENANDLVFSLDSGGRFTSINAAAERLLGYPRDEMLGRTLADLASERHAALAREACDATAPEAGPRRFELEVRTREGRVVVLEVSARARRQDGRADGLEGIARDVTERKHAEEELRRKEDELRESQERYALAVRGTNDGVWDWDLRADRVYFSPRWKSMLGYAEEEVGETPGDWFRLVHPDDLERLEAKLGTHREGLASHFEHEHRMLHKDGTYRWVLSRGFALREGDGPAYRMAGAQTDVTDRRSYDPLTGLPNRALFAERLEKAVSRSRHATDYWFGVLFLDLDRFKFVNDSLGHLAGDLLLVTFARRLEECVRPSDVIARFGGDEFAILVDGITGPSDAAHVAERVQNALEAPFNLGGHEVYTTASVGIALSATGYERAEDLLRDADTAMYRAKGGGRARYELFDASMREHVTTFMQTENDLRHALERDELRVYYQPIVELTTGAVVAIEALVRWQHPERGFLTPGDFMEVAEETGLIVSIGEWVLRRACREARSWGESLPPAPRPAVCVNLSSRQVADSRLVSRVQEALTASGLEPSRLILEITESAIMEDADAAVARIAPLKEMGLRFHLDDFGTGYSSLGYLHRLPIDALKVDRSFVSAMGESDEAHAVVRSILSLADHLRLKVIAEGVETEAQVGLLRGLGCEQAQGLYFSPPIEPAAVAALISSEAGALPIAARRSRPVF